MTYGQLAALCGNARAADGGDIAHFGDHLPRQRVVNKAGAVWQRLSTGDRRGHGG